MAGIEDLNIPNKPNEAGLLERFMSSSPDADTFDYQGRQQQIEARARLQKEQGKERYLQEILDRARKHVDLIESGASQENIDRAYNNAFSGFTGNLDAVRNDMNEEIFKEQRRRQGPSNSMERNLMQQEQLGFAQGGVVTDVDIFS